MEKPLCPYFGACGGCRYQHLSYEEELALKEEALRRIFREEIGLDGGTIQTIVPSPAPYFYRSRLDLTLGRIRGVVRLGLNQEGAKDLIPIQSCAIARVEISDFIPTLEKLASARLPENYRGANIVVKTGDNGEVRWGGIGKGSLRMSEPDYFWTEIEGKRIHYSLDTFFQANLAILPVLMKEIRRALGPYPEMNLLDLYAGVGLFWVVLASEVNRVWAVEDNPWAVRAAEFNRRYHGLSNVLLRQGRTEDLLTPILKELEGKPQAAVVDPPRSGLSPTSLQKLTQAKTLDPLIYVSCHPPSLLRDLRGFLKSGWTVDQVTPIDFFPRTQHLETIVRLRSQ